MGIVLQNIYNRRLLLSTLVMVPTSLTGIFCDCTLWSDGPASSYKAYFGSQSQSSIKIKFSFIPKAHLIFMKLRLQNPGLTLFSYKLRSLLYTWYASSTFSRQEHLSHRRTLPCNYWSHIPFWVFVLSAFLNQLDMVLLGCSRREIVYKAASLHKFGQGRALAKLLL